MQREFTYNTNGNNITGLFNGIKTEMQDDKETQITWTSAFPCGTDTVRSGEKTRMDRPKSALQDADGKHPRISYQSCPMPTRSEESDEDFTRRKPERSNSPVLRGSVSISSSSIGSTQIEDSDDEWGISADSLGSESIRSDSEDDEPTTSDDDFIASDGELSGSEESAYGSSDSDMEEEFPRGGGHKYKREVRQYRKKLLTSEPIRNGMVYIRSIDNAVVDNDSGKFKRLKLREQSELKGTDDKYNLGGWCFSWFSVQLRNDLCNVTLYRKLAERRKQHINSVYDRANSTALRDILLGMERKMGPTIGTGIKITLRPKVEHGEQNKTTKGSRKKTTNMGRKR